MSEEFRVVTGEQLRKEYGHWEKSGQVLNPERVPLELRHLIPFAEAYGVSDDIARETLFGNTPRMDLLALAQLIDDVDKDLDLWLAGPESTADHPSKEYVAFSALRMFALSIGI